MVVNVAASLQTIDRNLEMAAANLGAGPIRTFFKITLPLILPGVVAGALFAFIESWDEVVVSIFLSSPFVRTLPVVMWSVVRSQIDPTIAALAGMLTVADDRAPVRRLARAQPERWKEEVMAVVEAALRADSTPRRARCRSRT